MNDGHAARIEAALAQCASEPVHIPGRIQPHGAIIAIDNETLVITHASANLEETIGVPVETALGQSVYDTFSKGIRHDLVNLLLPEYLKQDTRVPGAIMLNGRSVFASASAAGHATVIEFEPTDDKSDFSDDAIRQIALLTSQLQAAERRSDLFEKSVSLLRVLTGYDRIMVYEFDANGNGTVRAEAVNARMEPYLGLNFPAWDIPQQAREIMARTQIRCICDVKAEEVPVLAANSDLPALDMTFSHLRGVSPVHLEYLANMNTFGSLTLNIVVDGKLWGMIALHQSVPRVPNQTVREVCRSFIRFFGLKLDGILQRERLTRLREADQLRKELTETAARDEVQVRFNEHLLRRLCDAMRADGAVLSMQGTVQSHGLVPQDDRIGELMAFGENRTDVFHSAALAAEQPDLAGCVGPDIAGVHITPMANDSFIAFFRRDRERETVWAGAPEKTIEGHGASARLRPRARRSRNTRKRCAVHRDPGSRKSIRSPAKSGPFSSIPNAVR